MPDKTKKPRTRSEKKIGRLRIGFNVLVQIVLVLFLVAMVNSFAFKHYARWDFSRDQKYALSDKTKRFLDTLNGKMRVTVFFAPNTPITADVQNLLTEYQYAGKGKIDVEHVDPERNLSRAKELFDKYKVVTDESLLVLDYDGRNKTVKASRSEEHTSELQSPCNIVCRLLLEKTQLPDRTARLPSLRPQASPLEAALPHSRGPRWHAPQSVHACPPQDPQPRPHSRSLRV